MVMGQLDKSETEESKKIVLCNSVSERGWLDNPAVERWTRDQELVVPVLSTITSSAQGKPPTLSCLCH